MTERRPRNEQGISLPSPLVALSVIAVALAGIAFFATQGSNEGHQMATVSKQQPSTLPPAEQSIGRVEKPDHQKVEKKHKKARPEVERASVYVEVYNNSGISGLAASTATTAAGAGWNVVGTDNWYGTIPSSTVYYPSRYEKAARALARDLGISRVLPAVDPMRFDRLTVILTSDHA